MINIDKVLQEIKSRRGKTYTTKKDIIRIQKAKESGDWQEVHNSKLYNKHSGEYCELLQIIH